MFRYFLILFIVLFSFSFSKQGNDGLIDMNKSFRDFMELSFESLPFVEECIENKCSLDSLVVFNHHHHGHNEFYFGKRFKKGINSVKHFAQYYHYTIERAIYRNNKWDNNNNFTIKINNGVIEEIKWVDDELYKPIYMKVKKHNEYYLEHGWKYVNENNKYGIHVNVHSGKKTDCGGNPFPSH